MKKTIINLVLQDLEQQMFDNLHYNDSNQTFTSSFLITNERESGESMMLDVGIEVSTESKIQSYGLESPPETTEVCLHNVKIDYVNYDNENTTKTITEKELEDKIYDIIEEVETNINLNL